MTLRRREFIVGGSAAAAGPISTRAQRALKLPTIGFLVVGTHTSHGQWIAAFEHRLRELGWIEDRTVAIEYRWAEGRSERFAEIAVEFVEKKVDVIVTSSTPAVVAAKRATSVIPIVFAAAADPVDNELVASLARPEGNVTGLSLQSTDLAGKRLELLREVDPDFRRLAIMTNAGNPITALEVREAQAAARTLALDVVSLEIRRAEDIAPAIEGLKGHEVALYVQTDTLMTTNRSRINTLALSARLSHDLWCT